MVSSETFASLAMALPGTTSAPQFDRVAFKAKRIYATLAGDGLSVNFYFAPDEQQLKCMLAPDLFRPVDNAWGRSGWTVMDLTAATEADVKAALQMAHAHGAAKRK